MADPFTNFILKLQDLGFFNFLLPWMIMAALLYGMMRKAKLFGEGSELVNIVASLGISFFILYFPIVSGLELGPIMSKFFMQLSVFFLAFILALVGSSIWYPDLQKTLEKTETRAFIWIFVVAVIVIFFTSGMNTVLFKMATGVGGPSELSILISGLFVLMIFLFIATAVVTYYKKKEE